jgi:hypothetical protein
MNSTVTKLYKIMLRDQVSKLESHYFDKICLMILITHSKKINNYWAEDDAETIILDCEKY